MRPGYDVVWPNREIDEPETILPFITNIQVLVDVKNFGKNFNDGSTFHRFLTEGQPTANLGATITANIDVADLSATIESNNPFFEYGKVIVLEIEADDLEGNQLRLTHTFVIEDKPN